MHSRRGLTESAVVKRHKEHKMNECFFFIRISDFIDYIILANTNCVISKYKSVLRTINHNEKS